MIEQFIDSFPIVEYLIGKGARQVQTHQWVLTCPLCGKQKLAVSDIKKSYHCWVCQRYGNVNSSTGKREILSGAGSLIDLIQMLEKCTRWEAINFIIAQSKNIINNLQHIPDLLNKKLLDNPKIISNDTQELPYPDGSCPITEELPYMKQRGITREDARDFKLFYCNIGKYAGRLMFPVFEDNKLVYYQGRAMFPLRLKEQKSLNPSKQESNGHVSTEFLGNLDQASGFKKICICEGPISAIHCGIDSVWSFGKQLSYIQIGKMIKYGVESVDLMFDGPEEKHPTGAWDEMMFIAPTLSNYFETRLVLLPRGDPGEYNRDQNAEFRKKAASFKKLSKIENI